MRSRTGIILALLTTCVFAPAALAQEGRLVEVGGHDLYVYTAGWHHLERGQPIVVIEGGSTTAIQAWENVLTRVAEQAPVVAFDSPGIGRSDWDEQRPTVEHMNERLQQILDAIDAPAPYILVGHSWASWLVRAFAGRYPEKVAGLVLIDPTPPQAAFLAAFEEIGAGERGMNEFTQMMQRMTATWPAPIRAQQDVIAEYAERRADPDVPPTPTVPVVVLVAGHYGDTSVPDGLRPSFDLNQFFIALRRRQSTAPIEWTRSSPDGTLVLTGRSGHCIHCEDPDLVAWAILRVLTSVRSEP